MKRSGLKNFKQYHAQGANGDFSTYHALTIATQASDFLAPPTSRF